MNLKSQDIVVLLKLSGYPIDERPPYLMIGQELSISASEVHASVKRLENSRLVHEKEMGGKPNFTAIEEFLIHGVKYAFPAERGSLTRGTPTSYAAEPLCRMIQAGREPAPVWADPLGSVRGIALVPLYKTVPAAAKRDALLYRRLALLDAVRDGRARERNLAERELRRSLRDDS